MLAMKDSIAPMYMQYRNDNDKTPSQSLGNDSGNPR